MMTSRPSYFSRYDSSVRLVAICILVIAVLTILRGIFAATIELRVDEAYYWTWSKENVISYLDHPPMIAWFIRFGRFAFGDTGFGVRFSGLLAMLVTQLLLADIVWQSLRDPRYVAIAVLLPEVAIEHWFALTKVTPDTALIPFALAMVWSLVRFSLSENPRSTSVLFPLGFFVWRAFHSRVGDSWPLFVWPFGFASVAINLKSWRREAPASPLTWLTPSIVSGIALMAVVFIYYSVGNTNYLANNDPIGKEAGFPRAVEAIDRERQKIGGAFFATTDCRIYSMLRWFLRDRVPIVQVNERNRFIDFTANEHAFVGLVGLYVAPKDRPVIELWRKTGAALEPVGNVDLTWRGFRYDTYALQKLTGWKPVFAPPPGAPPLRQLTALESSSHGLQRPHISPSGLRGLCDSLVACATLRASLKESSK
jgi:hypothetical protein